VFGQNRLCDAKELNDIVKHDRKIVLELLWLTKIPLIVMREVFVALIFYTGNRTRMGFDSMALPAHIKDRESLMTPDYLPCIDLNEIQEVRQASLGFVLIELRPVIERYQHAGILR